MATVTYDKATRIYPGATKPAVDALDLQIEDGEFLVLVGPSGCGKSTCLRMLAGLEEVNSGRILIGDRDVTPMPPKDRDIAMVFQSYALYPHMTVAQNIAFSLKLARMPRRQIKERVAETARLLAIEELLDRRPKQLSGGQRQRVAMGRAIVRQPQAFLMDEPLSNLDAQLRVQMRGEIEALQKRLGVTTVYVTHDQVEAMTMGDRVAVLRDGELQQVDTPTEVYERPANLFVAGFIGSPPMNLAQATVEGGSVKLGELTIPAPRGLGGRVVVGIRPEDLQGRAGSNGRVSFEAKIERVEALGPTILGYFSVDAPAAGVAAAVTGDALADAPVVGHTGTPFCATFEPRSGLRIGDTVRVGFDVERLHFFELETSRRL